MIDEIEACKVNYVVVSSIDRLDRNLLEIVGTLEYFNSKGVVLAKYKEVVKFSKTGNHYLI